MLEACYDHGIKVSNVPDYCIDEVADHSISLGLTLFRRIPAYNKFTHEGQWHWDIDGLVPKRFSLFYMGFDWLWSHCPKYCQKDDCIGFQSYLF